MKIISFNINGIRARLHQLQALINKHQPDIIGLQEIKVHDDEFPLADVQALQSAHPRGFFAPGAAVSGSTASTPSGLAGGAHATPVWVAQAPATEHPMAAAASANAAANPFAAPATSAARLQDVALQAMTDALRQCQGNVSAAAKLLGVSRNTIYRKKEQLPADVWG